MVPGFRPALQAVGAGLTSFGSVIVAFANSSEQANNRGTLDGWRLVVIWGCDDCRWTWLSRLPIELTEQQHQNLKASALL